MQCDGDEMIIRAIIASKQLQTRWIFTCNRNVCSNGVLGKGLVNGFFGMIPAFFLGTMCIVHVSKAPENSEKD